MMLFYPSYYPLFACSADKCRHNCCIGWEIDIDESTLSYYDQISGEMGARLARSISREGDCACFILDREERCPFLNREGLCDIILQLGEEALSDICTDHPRYRHFFESRTELGLGLSCESAARLILARREKTILIEDQSQEDAFSAPIPPEEAAFFAARERLFSLAEDRLLSLDARMDALLREGGVSMPQKSYRAWASFYRSLERMDTAFLAVIDGMEKLLPSSAAGDEILFEQLLVYFLYRHYTPENQASALGFAVHATRLLRDLAVAGELSFEETAELCRLYSSEIEYSEENTDALLSLFA